MMRFSCMCAIASQICAKYFQITRSSNRALRSCALRICRFRSPAAAHSNTMMSSSPSMNESMYSMMFAWWTLCSSRTSFRHLSRAFWSIASIAIFLIATSAPSDLRCARYTTANLPLPIGLTTS